VVLAKSVPGVSDRRRAMTALTMVAGLASFVFLPLSQALIDGYGWRDALVVLAAVLAAVTVPLHALVVGRAAASGVAAAAEEAPSGGAALRSVRFRLLAGAFFFASIAAAAVFVLGIPLLLSRGYDASFAAFAIGLAGAAQIPGRGVFGTVVSGLPRAVAMAAVFAPIVLGTGVLAAFDAAGAVLVGTVLLGMGNGMATLARATAMADHFGVVAYGTVAGVAAAWSTAARAIGPSAGALVAAAHGYADMLWTLCALATVAGLMACAAELRPWAVR
jgi:predicted MFS family arabinose efflux permease